MIKWCAKKCVYLKRGIEGLFKNIWKIVDGTGDKNCLWKMVSDSKILWEQLICKKEYKIKLGDGWDDKHGERKIDLRKSIFW